MPSSNYNPSDEEEDTTINPLTIPHIVKQILYYTVLKDLKNARLVSKQWNHCSTKVFKLRSKLYFYNFRHIDNFMALSNNFPIDLCHNVCLFGKDFQDWVVLLRPFFTKFGTFINSLDISHGIGEVTEEFMLQIAQHIPYLEELSLSGSNILYTDRNIDGGGFHFYPMLPSVKVLKLKISKTCFKRWSDVRTFFSDLLSLFPNVKSITFNGYQFPELFKYLPLDIQFPKLYSIHLNLCNSEGLSHLISRNFRLCKIVLDIEPLVGLTNLHAFLEAFAPTLKHLDMSFNYKGVYNYSHNATAFPSSISLIHLNYLRLFGFFGNLYFLNDFQELKMSVVERMKWEIAFPEGVEKLEFSRMGLKFFDENGTYHSVM